MMCKTRLVNGGSARFSATLTEFIGDGRQVSGTLMDNQQVCRLEVEYVRS